MKKSLKKLMAMLMVSCMITSCFPVELTYAEENGTAESGEESKDQASAEEAGQESLEEKNQNSAEEAEQNQVQEKQDAEDVSGNTEAEGEESRQEIFEESVIEKNKDQINYVFVETPYLETPGTERIAVSYGDGTEQVQSAVLEVENQDGETEQWKSTVNVENLYLFEKEYKDESTTGIYNVIDLLVTDESGEHKEILSDYEMEAQFGVNREYDGLEDLKPLDQETAEAQAVQTEDAGAVSATVVEVNSENPETSVKEIKDALENAEEETDLSAQASSEEKGSMTASRSTSVLAGSMAAVAAQIQKLADTKTKAGKYVVALDPGHDSTHAGASGIGGLKEEVLTLKIANYCKTELEKYSGVSVYMTRTTAACPNPNSTSSGDDIGKRVQAAVKAGADIYVSIHLNSSASSSGSNGAEVIVPNKNWKPEVAEEGTELAKAILKELKAVGVNMRPTEIYSKDTTIDETYPDGSKSDYFSVQIYAKEAGIPGIIVEHAFLTNENDVNKFLKTESGLQKLGVADATGIAKYLGLSKGKEDESWGNTPELNIAKAAKDTINVSWKSVKGASGYAVYRKEAGQVWSMIGTTSSTSYADAVENLDSGTMYYYTVRAYKGSKSQALSNKYKAAYWTSYDANGTVAFYMTTPKVSKAQENEKGIKVTWKAVSGATGYAVYRKKGSGDWSMIGTTTSLEYTDQSSLDESAKYYYTLRAYHGNRSEALSNKYNAEYWSYYDGTGVQATRLDYLVTPVLKGNSTAAGGILVKWKTVYGASGYAVYRKTVNGSWKMLATTTDAQYTDKNVSNNTTYYYTVRAYKGSLKTATANKYSSKYWSGYDKNGAKAVYLNTPQLTSVEIANSGFKVKWNAVTGATGYEVYRKSGNAGWELLGTTSSVSYQDKNAKSTVEYYYTVRAYRGNAATAMEKRYNAEYWSHYDSKGVKSEYIATPQLKTVTATASGSKVSWQSVSGASGYAVYRKISGGSWEMITTTEKTEYVDTANLMSGKTYYYTVRAYKGSLKTATANKYSSQYWSYYQTEGVKFVYTAIPALIRTTAVSQGISVKWKESAGASGYAVYRKTSSGDWKMIDTTTKTTYSDKNGIDVGKEYCYTVRAYRGNYDGASKNKYNASWWSGYDPSGLKAKYISTPVLNKTKISNTGIEVSWGTVSGASGYAIYRKTGTESWKWISTVTGAKYTDTSAKFDGTEYSYTVRAYKGKFNEAKQNQYSCEYWSYYDTVGVSGSAYQILGTSKVTVAQMVNLYKKYATTEYPQQLAKGGAKDIQQLAEIFYEEANDEGIRAEVAWCQAMIETGYLKFNGDVKVEQYNFAGLGATGGGAQGASFSNVREGVRAQIQHLKAYADETATEKNLKHNLVDPRFQYVSKGAAKFVEILGAKENPNGTGWATAENYGYKILNLIDKM